MKKAMGAVTLMMLFQLLFQLTASIVPAKYAVKNIILCLSMLVPAIHFYLSKKGNSRDTLVKDGITFALCLTPIMLLTCSLMSIGITAISERLGWGTAADIPQLNPYSLIFSVIITPISEELFVRGAIIGTIEKDNRSVAIIISAILFALMHINLMTLPYAFAAGIFLGIARISSRSVTAPILMHALNNLVTILCNEAASKYGATELYTTYLITVVLLCTASFIYICKSRNILSPLTDTITNLKNERRGVIEALRSPILIYVIALIPLFILNA